ncbi:MAG: CBS domain-containing protein [Candidatus Bathyarchaeia archaeon]
MKVNDLKTELTTVESSAPLTRVISILRERSLYEVFIVDGPKMGMVSIRDILKSTHIHSRKASSLAIQIPSLNPETDIDEAVRVMTEYRVRALPIVDKGVPMGEITALSICKALSRSEGLGFTVDKVMTPHPLTLDVADPLGKAKALINHRNIDHLPILQKGRIIGVLTSQRLLDSMIPPERLTKQGRKPEALRIDRLSVQGLMDEPIICHTDDNASSVLDEMIKSMSTCSLITFGEELQGIVTYRDFMKLLAKAEKPNIPVYMVGLPANPFESEVARDKFTRVVDLLRRSFPDILEARCTIKTSNPVDGKDRKRYEVKAFIYTPRRVFSYSEEGWELPSLFDTLSYRLKSAMSRREKLRRRRRT